MKQVFLTIILTVVCDVTAWCANGDLFRSKTIEGVELMFTVTDEANKYCQVGYLKEDGTINIAVSFITEGTVTIPSTVKGYRVTGIAKNAFYQCQRISTVIIPNTVTSISEQAFYGCSNLSSITIPDDVTYIGRYAFESTKWLNNQSAPVYAGKVFYLCKGGSNVNIKEGTVSIAEDAFSNLSSLVSVTIPNTIKYIWKNAFWFCKNLSYLDIPKSVTYIHEYAIRGCSGLQGIYVDSGNEFYDSRESCNALIETSTNKLLVGCQSTTIPTSVLSIRDYAFENCTGKLGLTIPDNVKSIGSGAFSGCTNLKSITLPSEITEIKSSTFRNCSNLSSISIPNSVETIEAQAFEGCSLLKTVNLSNSLKSVGVNAFQNCTSLLQIIFPEGMQTIGRNAFNGCTNLAYVSIPSTVTSIGEKAFDGTKWYENMDDGVLYLGNLAYCYKGTMSENCSITLKEGTTAIADRAFLNQTTLTSVNIPSSLKTIGDGAFQGCTGLTSLALPENLEQIGSIAFSGCSGLTSVNLPNQLTSIGHSAFNGCSGLKSINIPSGITTIQYSTFSGCSNVSTVTLPENLTTIQPAAFSGCTSLSSIIIPFGVTSVGASAFYGCSSLANIEILAKGAIRIDNNAFNETKWYNLRPDGLVYLGNNVYKYKGDMEENMVVHIKEGIISISPWAFNNWKLSAVYIPRSVQFIYDYAFVNCSNLKSVYVKSITPPAIETGNTFPYRLENATLYVPLGTETSYANAKYWKEFSNIVEHSMPIDFADANVKAFCVANWDADGDGELTDAEAAAVKSLGNVFEGTNITSFNELRYFTGLTSIGEKAFADCTQLVSVSIPTTVKSIGMNAFMNCKNLASLELPDGLKTIQSWAFSNCSSLSAITIPASVTNIVSGCFYGCVSLTSLKVDEANTVYDSRDNCNAIIKTTTNELIAASQTTVIPVGIKKIGDYAFSSRKDLVSIELPEGMESLGQWVFSGCTNLESLSFPSTMQSYGQYTLSGVSSMRRITVNALVPPADKFSNFFMGVPDDFDINKFTWYVPKGTRERYASVIPWWSNQGKGIVEHGEDKDIITFADDVVKQLCVAKYDGNYSGELDMEEAAGALTIDNTYFSTKTFKGNTSIRTFDEFRFFTSIEVIGSNFSGCTSLTSVMLPESLKQIGSYAFSDCALSTVTIPQYVSSIGNNAFYCEKMESVVMMNPEPITIGQYDNPFPQRSLMVLYVPADSKAAYTAADYWKDFKEIIEVSSYMPGDINGDDKVDVSDYIGVANRILNIPQEGFNEQAADVNEDGRIDVSDYIGVANIILTGSPYGTAASRATGSRIR